MKSLCIVLFIFILSSGFKHQVKKPLILSQLTLKAKDDVSDLDVDLSSSDVPTINSPEENEEYMTSMIDSESSSNEEIDSDEACEQGLCTHKMKNKMQELYNDEDEEEDEDENSDTDATMPCDFGKEITDE